MANAREIQKRIKSVQSTKKITRTMELVATSKMKKAQDRVLASRPYASKIREILARLSDAGTGDADHPLLRVPDEKSGGKKAIFVVTSNRGLCGAYNTNVIRLAQKYLNANDNVDIYASGKKAIGYFKYRKIELSGSYTDPSDSPRYEHAQDIAGKLVDAFCDGEIDGVSLVYTRFVSAGKLQPVVEQLLPFSTEGLDEQAAEEEEQKGGPTDDVLFEPSAEDIVGTLLPLMVKMRFFEVLLNAQASEHSARMVAMKSATDNAGELIDNLNRIYNRERQGQITQELAEILGGVEALKG